MLERSRSNSGRVISLADDIPQRTSELLEVFLPNIGFSLPRIFVRHSNREFRSQMLMEFGIAGWTLHHRSVDMSGLQPTALNLPDVGGVNPVDKISVPFSVRIEVGSKHAVYENIDDIAEA